MEMYFFMYRICTFFSKSFGISGVAKKQRRNSSNCDKQPHPAQIVVLVLIGHGSAVFYKVAETPNIRKRRVGLGFS